MRNLRKISSAIFGLLMAVSIHAAPVVVSFDDLGDNGVLADGYGGIQWGGEWTYYSFAQTPYNPSSGVGRAFNNMYRPVTAFGFTTSVAFSGAFFAGIDYADVAFELLLDGELKHTSNTLRLTSDATFLASGYVGLVDQVRVISTGYYVIDDVAYDTAAASEIPEPGALLLVATAGLGGLVVRKRQFHRRK